MKRLRSPFEGDYESCVTKRQKTEEAATFNFYLPQELISKIILDGAKTVSGPWDNLHKFYFSCRCVNSKWHKATAQAMFTHINQAKDIRYVFNGIFQGNISYIESFFSFHGKSIFAFTSPSSVHFRGSLFLEFKLLPNLKFFNFSPGDNFSEFLLPKLAAHCSFLEHLHASSPSPLVIQRVSDFKNLRKLTFFNGEEITNHSIETIKINNPLLQMEQFHVYSSQIDVAGLSHIYKVFPNLTFLNLYGSKSLTHLGSIGQDLQHLKTLILNKCSTLNSLKEMAGTLPHLTTLDLGETKITDSNLASIVDSFSELTNLNLSGCHNLHDISIISKSFPKLEILNLSTCYSIKKICGIRHSFQKLKVLNISSTSVTSLKNLTRSFTDLRSLNLKSLAIDDEKLFQIKDCFTKLSKLNLKQCPVKRLSTISSNFPSLNKINLEASKIETFNQGDKIYPALTCLDLSAINLKDQDLLCINECYPKLKILKIYSGLISTNGLTRFARECPAKDLVVHLYDHNIQDSNFNNKIIENLSGNFPFLEFTINKYG